MINDSANVMSKVRRALGRSVPLTVAPIPPELAEGVIRLTSSHANLAEVFTARATACKMGVEAVEPGALPGRLVEFLRGRNLRRIALPRSDLLERLGVGVALRDAGLDVASWPEMTLDALYDVEAAVTDVFKAVAETGSLVMRSTPEHGRALSLVPPVHVAIVERGSIVPDLVDLFAFLTAEKNSAGITIISGPSKTADIEMNLVTGVHGPGVVQIFTLP
jgi:L-lactate dehydrogenase complex protein LldG